MNDELIENNRCDHEGCHIPATRIANIGSKRGFSCGNHDTDKPYCPLCGVYQHWGCNCRINKRIKSL